MNNLPPVTASKESGFQTAAQNQAQELVTDFLNMKSNPRLSHSQAINSAILCVEREILWVETLMGSVNGYAIAFSAMILTKKEVIQILKSNLKNNG